MIGYGSFGVIIFALSIFYRPLRLFDRMLGVIASKMPEAIFFFDTNDKCIWVNEKATILFGIDDDNLDDANEILTERLNDYQKEGNDWESIVSYGEGDDFKCYIIQKQSVSDGRNRIVGSYLSIRDDSEAQLNLQRESFNAHHDQLTKIYNRAGYDDVMENIDLSKCFLLLVDLDSFKDANDKYGHIAGDNVLVRIASTLDKYFGENNYFCRIGGDEFAVIMPNVNNDITNEIKHKVELMNEELLKQQDYLPCITVNADGAYGKDAENAYELYNNADNALYKTKFGGKHGFTLYEKR